MSLVKVRDLERMADEQNACVLAFNVGSWMQIETVIRTAEELKKPVILMLDPRFYTMGHWIDPETFAIAVKQIAEQVDVPISFHLDHCWDFDLIERALKAGFPSVMYDGSTLPIEENIANTKKVVEMARKYDADVEAELGHVGFAANRDGVTDDLYTQPKDVEEFTKQTGCSAIAVAIGSAHGVYIETPKLDLERLEKINSITDTPIVLHGGSGIPEDQLRAAFKRGINKLNVGTELNILMKEAMKDFGLDESPNAIWFPLLLQERLREYLLNKMQLCEVKL